MKNYLRKLIYNRLLRWLLEETPFGKWINGHKEEIGKVVLFIGAILELASRTYPEFSYIPEAYAFWTLYSGYLLMLLGVTHAEDKELRGIPRKP